MKRITIVRAIAALCLSLPTLASAATPVTVPATANIFCAGLSTPQGTQPGTLPIQVSIVLAPGMHLQFQASGTIFLGGGAGPTGPDGYAAPYAPMNITSLGGISGYFGPGFALVGVFLTDAVPASSPPSTLDFTGNNLHPDFRTLSPALGQVFFIGDGQADGLGAETFIVPAGATRLFLGLTDCNNASGPPGWYADNSGSLSVTVDQVLGSIIRRLNPGPSPNVPNSTELIESSPAIGPNGHIYFTTRQPPGQGGLGFIYEFTQDGQPVHRVPMVQSGSDGIISSPSITSTGAVFAACGNQVLRWPVGLGGASQSISFLPDGSGDGTALVASTPTIGPDNTIYVGTDDSSERGVWRWQSPYGAGDKHQVFDFPTSVTTAEAHIDESLALSQNGTLYFVGEKNNFAAAVDSQAQLDPLNPANSLIWLAPVATDMISELRVRPGSLHQRFRASGDVPHFNSSPAIASDGTVYVGAQHGLCALNRSGDVNLLSPRIDLKDLVDPEMRSFRSSPVIGPDGAVYIGCDNGKFYAFLPSGQSAIGLKWIFTPDWVPSPAEDPCRHRPPIISSAAIADDHTVYITCSTDAGKPPFSTDIGTADENDNSVLFALDTDTGRIKWKTVLDGVLSPSSPAIADDGTIWVADMTTMYAIKGASPLAADAPWPMFQHDPTHTGRQNAGPCPTVQILTAVPGIGSVELSWLGPANATYTVKRAESDSSVFNPIGSTTGTSYVDNGPAGSRLRPHTTYSYIVETTCGPSSASKPKTVTTLPVVVNLQFSATGLPGKVGTAAFLDGLLDQTDQWNLLTSCCRGLNNGPGVAGDTFCVDRDGVSTGSSTAPGIHAEFWTPIGISDYPVPAINTGSPIDDLLRIYMTELNGNPIYVRLSNVPPGTYDIYLYGCCGSQFSMLGGCTGSSGLALDVPKSTSPPDPVDPFRWIEDNQYVVFRDQLVSDLGTVLIKVSIPPPGTGVVLNGLQLVTRGQTLNLQQNQCP